MKKHKKTLAVLCAVLMVCGVQAQNRTYDGLNNNLLNPEWGATGQEQLYYGGVDYSDGIGEPSGDDRPNSRALSNHLFNQGPEEIINSPLELSDFVWSFGQFLDHDITIAPETEDETIMIQIPECDPFFDPLCEGDKVMPVHRSTAAPGTGQDVTAPRKAMNDLSAFIDGSNVYGSDEGRANWLRTFENGKLKVSAGNMLPYNTDNLEVDGQLAPGAPLMSMMDFSAANFVAGDRRANEQPSLICLHTLFVREHNRLCDEIIAENPAWPEEAVYQRARKIVGAQLQAITYNEFLPALGVEMDEYSGYDIDVNPGILNSFSTAAFRLGHTMVSENLVLLDETTGETEEIHLTDAFFNPDLVSQADLDPFFLGMAHNMQQSFDTKVVHSLRNFLFGPPGAGGMDLAAINIERGRERGVPAYNDLREAFGLERYTDFDQISDDATQVFNLSSIYDTVDDIDAWVGMLSEKKETGREVGELTMTVIAYQFEALRSGDRYFYKSDPTFTSEERTTISNTSLADIIIRNTNITSLQDNVFFFEPLPSVTTFIDSATNASALSAYPNPAKDYVQIQFEGQSNGNVSLELSSLTGQVIQQWSDNAEFGKNEINVDLGALENVGFYLLTVTTDDFRSVVKLSIQ